MTPEQLRRVEAAYFAVREAPAGERGVTLERECEGDAEVRREVEALLQDGPGAAFLATPVLGAGVLASIGGLSPDDGPDALVGKTVGPWRVERLLGAGGMGTVYLAARADGAFEGLAAIKVVKRGMDTDEILRRFRDERRTLANLRHPNIAAVHDAGSLPDGRPYLVMEFVDGKPITDFCREKQAGTPERLRLFATVCRAVQFAHQNLVVHRDLKPGNIFVTAEGTPKLLDFGIAKVLPAAGTAVAVTEMEQRRLTPEYASPEQVEGRAITTVADVYSLGVVLYELLSGVQPYSFATRTPEEVKRVVSAGGTAPPSAAVTRATGAGRARGDVTPARLRRELRGDLDTIVMMAMRREPERRYSSAEQLAADLDRFVAGMPVVARRDTVAYRASKFVRRHYWAVSAAAIALAGLAVGVMAIERQRDQAFIARDQSEEIAKFLQDAIASADPQHDRPGLTVREMLDRAADRVGAQLSDQPAVHAAVRSAIGTAYLGLGVLDRAEEHVRAAYEQRLALLGAGHHDTAESMVDLGAVLYERREFEEAERLLRDALAVFTRIRGNHNLDIARTLNNLGAVLRVQGKIDEAEGALARAVAIRRSLGRETLDLAESLNNYAGVQRARNQLKEATASMEEVLRIRRAILARDHPLVVQAMSNLAVMVGSAGDWGRAEALLREAVSLLDTSLGPDHLDRSWTEMQLAALLMTRQRPAEAAPVAANVVRIRAQHLKPGDPRVVQARTLLSKALEGSGNRQGALVALEPALRADEESPVDQPAREGLHEWAADLLQWAGDTERAAKYQKTKH